MRFLLYIIYVVTIRVYPNNFTDARSLTIISRSDSTVGCIADYYCNMGEKWRDRSRAFVSVMRKSKWMIVGIL